MSPARGPLLKVLFDQETLAEPLPSECERNCDVDLKLLVQWNSRREFVVKSTDQRNLNRGEKFTMLDLKEPAYMVEDKVNGLKRFRHFRLSLSRYEGVLQRF